MSVIQNVPDQDVRSLKNVNRPWNRLHQINDHFESKQNPEIGHYGRTVINHQLIFLVI
jgi:hypothetical protein